MARTHWSLALILALMSISAFAQATLAQRASPLLDRDKEIETALSSAPPEVRARAGVYVPEERGFVKVRESQNGFNCIIERRANNISPRGNDADVPGSTL